MNMLLQAPGLLLVFLLSLGWWDTFVCLSICAITQLVLGYPFLSTFPVEYLKRSFDIGRVFMHIWTVNLKFLPEGIFIRKELGIVLLILTLVVMLLFGRKWIYEVCDVYLHGDSLLVYFGYFLLCFPCVEFPEHSRKIDCGP